MVHFRSNVMFLEGVRAITSQVALSVINVAMDYGVCLVKHAKVVFTYFVYFFLFLQFLIQKTSLIFYNSLVSYLFVMLRFYNPRKHQKILRCSGVFRGYANVTLGRNGLREFIKS